MGSPGHARYLTFSCYHRLPLFGNDAIKDAFVEHLAEVNTGGGFDLVAWVVMPEHVHLLLVPQRHDVTVAKLLMAIKRPFARRVLDRWRQLNAKILQQLNDRQGESHFWRAGGGYDRNIHSDHGLIEKVDYIHNNPVARGLVDRSVEWRWSSVGHYESDIYYGPTITRYDA